MTVQGDPPVFLEGHDSFVSTRGGEYLFLPGLTALGAIAAERRMPIASVQPAGRCVAREVE
jgi:hypothetical protein